VGDPAASRGLRSAQLLSDLSRLDPLLLTSVTYPCQPLTGVCHFLQEVPHMSFTTPTVVDVWNGVGGAPDSLRFSAQCRVVPANNRSVLTAGLTVCPYTHQLLFVPETLVLKDGYVSTNPASVPFDWAPQETADWFNLRFNPAGDQSNTWLVAQLVVHCFRDEPMAYIRVYCSERFRS
jgi:hypothetical protein